MTRRTTAGANAPSRSKSISQANIDRTALWVVNAALAVAFAVLAFLPG